MTDDCAITTTTTTTTGGSRYPIVREETPVRMDLSHCGWSDIFFLGMDFPEGARVLNASINLSVRRNNSSNTIGGFFDLNKLIYWKQHQIGKVG